MKVSELGEFGLIDLLARIAHGSRDSQAASWKQLLIGIGDDAAAWQGDTSIQLATVDSFIQDTHFITGIATWEEVGWKALAVNLSDIAAMGGVPRYALVALAFPGTTDAENVADIFRGLVDLAKQFGVAVIGGNISEAPLIVINVTVLGSVINQDRGPLTRSAAKPGDKVAVTGYLGTAAAGLKMLTGRLQFDPETDAHLRKAFLKPHPRVTEGQLLVEHGVKTAIDISDGLVSDLKHICQASRVSARIEAELLPIRPSVRANFGEKSLELAGGEDYELLFTGSTEVIEKVKKAASCPVTIIGEITAGEYGVTVLDSQGQPLELDRAGWDHFSRA